MDNLLQAINRQAFSFRCDLAADAASRTIEFSNLTYPLHQAAYSLLEALEKQSLSYEELRDRLAAVDFRLLQLYRPGASTPQTYGKLPEPLKACFLGLRRTDVEACGAKWSIQKLNEKEQWHLKTHQRELVAAKNTLLEEHLDLLEKRIGPDGRCNDGNDRRIAECHQYIFEGFFFTQIDKEYHSTQMALIQKRQAIDQEIRNYIAAVRIGQRGQRNQDAPWISEFFTKIEEQRAQFEAVDAQKRHAEADEQERSLADLEYRTRETFEKIKAAGALSEPGSGYATPTNDEATPKASGATVGKNTDDTPRASAKMQFEDHAIFNAVSRRPLGTHTERFSWADQMNKAAAAAQGTVPAQAQPGPRVFNHDTERIPLQPDYCPPPTDLPRFRWARTPSKFNRRLFDVENDAYFRATHRSTTAQAHDEFYDQLVRNGEVASCVLWLIEERRRRDGSPGEGDRAQTAQKMAAKRAERERGRIQEMFGMSRSVSMPVNQVDKVGFLQDLSNRASVRRGSPEADIIQNQRNTIPQPEPEPERVEKIDLGKHFGWRPLNEGPPPGMTIARYEHYLAKHQSKKTNNRTVSAIHNSIDANMPAHQQARMPVGYQGRQQRGEINQHRGPSVGSNLAHVAFDAEQLEQKRIADKVKKEQTIRMQKSEERRLNMMEAASLVEEVEDKRLTEVSRVKARERKREETIRLQREEGERLKQVEDDRAAREVEGKRLAEAQRSQAMERKRHETIRPHKMQQASLKQVEDDRLAAIAQKEKEDREAEELRRKMAEEDRLEDERQQRLVDQRIAAAVEAQRLAAAKAEQARLKQLEDDRLAAIAQKKKEDREAQEKIGSARLATIAKAEQEAREAAESRERKEREWVAAEELRLNRITDEKEPARLAAISKKEQEERLRRVEEERDAKEKRRLEEVAETKRLQKIGGARTAKELEQKRLAEELFQQKRIADERQKEEATRLLQKTEIKPTGPTPSTTTRGSNSTAARNPAGTNGAVVDPPTMARVYQLDPMIGKALESGAQTPLHGARYLGDIYDGTVVPVEGAMTPATEKLLKSAVAKDPRFFGLAASKFASPPQEPKVPTKDEVLKPAVSQKAKAKDGLEASRWASPPQISTAVPSAPSGPAQTPPKGVPLLMRRLFEQMASEGKLDPRYVAAYRARLHDEGASLRALPASAHPHLVLRDQLNKAYFQDVERMGWSSKLQPRLPIVPPKPAKKVAHKRKVDANYDAITRRVKELTAIEEARKAGNSKPAGLPIPDDYLASENRLHERLGFPVMGTDEWEDFVDRILDTAIPRAKLGDESPSVPSRGGTERPYFYADEKVQAMARRTFRSVALSTTKVGETNVAAASSETFVPKIGDLVGRVVSRTVVSTARVGEINIAASGSNRSLGSDGQLKYQTKEELEAFVQEGKKKAQMAELEALVQQASEALELEAVLEKARLEGRAREARVKAAREISARLEKIMHQGRGKVEREREAGLERIKREEEDDDVNNIQ